MENNENTSGKKESKKWMWVAIVSMVINVILIILLILRGNVDERVIMIEKAVVTHDTLVIQELKKIETNFNAAQFKQGKSDLSADAKAVLHKLGNLLNEYPELRLRIEGHTSAEGKVATNQRLSEARAKAAMDYLIEEEGVEPYRLKAIGYGSTKLKNPAKPKAPENRRTEFIVLD